MWNATEETELPTNGEMSDSSDSERLPPTMEPARSDAYDRLAEYINRRMRMSHIYQPLMPMELLIEAALHLQKTSPGGSLARTVFRSSTTPKE